MRKRDKLLQKAKSSPISLRFAEFQSLMKQCGWVQDHQTGSHQIWYSPKKFRISVQNKQGKAKTYQVRQFLTRYYEEADEDA